MIDVCSYFVIDCFLKHGLAPYAGRVYEEKYVDIMKGQRRFYYIPDLVDIQGKRGEHVVD